MHYYRTRPVSTLWYYVGHTPLVVGVIVFYVPRKSLTVQKPLILVSFDLKYSYRYCRDVRDKMRGTQQPTAEIPEYYKYSDTVPVLRYYQ